MHKLLLLVLFFPAACTSAPRSHSSLDGRTVPDATQVDIEDLMQRASDATADVPRGLRWWDDEHYLQFGDEQLMKVRAATGDESPLYDVAAMESALVSAGIAEESAAGLARRRSYTWLPENAGMLLRTGGRLYVYRFDEGARGVTSPGEVVGEALSPDGEWVGYVRGNNLYVSATRYDEERQLTFDGAPDTLNGRLDWVYQEEIYGRGDFNAFWWSPDSRRIAFLQLDETPVPEFRVEDHIPTYGEQEIWRYPKAGEANPGVRVGIVAAAGDEFNFADLDRWASDDRLVMQVDWTPDGSEVLLQIANRIQDRLDVTFVDAATGASRVAFTETTQSWARRSAIHWLSDGSFLWRSGHDGWAHLYQYTRTGSLVRQLTSGDFEVLSVAKMTDDAVYATTNETGILERQLWRIPLDGSARTRLTGGNGSHSVTVSPTARYGIHTWSSASDPGGSEIIDLADGSVVRKLGRGSKRALGPWRKPQFVQIENRSGFVMEAKMFTPPGFHEGGNYPTLFHVYGGPHAPSVRDRFGGFRDLWYERLSDLGILVVYFDNQSASGKGHEAASVMYKQAGQSELRDLEDAVAELARRGWTDPERVGIWGWSYGGYYGAYALTHSTKFAMAVVGAPVTDWRNYDTIYTERYMSTPQLNPEGYEAGSVLAAAENLHGKMLLIHGTMDENVHMANSMQFAYKLQNAGIPFELMVYPKNRHGVSRRAQRIHLYELMTRFILENL